MNASTAANVLLIGAAVIWVLARQVQRARIKPRLLLAAPLILAYFGIRGLPASTWRVPADLGLLALSAALSVGLGIWRGRTIRVWHEADGTWWRQGSMRTLALWGALIVARGLLYGLDAALGHREASGLGAILLSLAFSFAAQNAVTATRMNAAQPLAASRPTEPADGPGPDIPPQLTASGRLDTRTHERIQARRLERRGRREARHWGPSAP
jgi:hypothetical protein